MPTSRLNILVYGGRGASKTSLKHTIYSLQQSLSTKFDVKQVDEHDLEGPWESTCATLVIPGGRDKEYLAALDNRKVFRIVNFVKNGGKYIGICAGAYFACSSISFEEGRKDYEIIENRPLKFFPGVAVGAVNPCFSYNNESGAMAASIKLTNMPIAQAACYLNGGCYFDSDSGSLESWEIIGQYAETMKASIIKGPFGKGQVLLSGIHFEYAAALLDDGIPQKERDLLISNEGSRQILWNELIASFLNTPIGPVVMFEDLPVERLVGNVDFGDGVHDYTHYFSPKDYLNVLNSFAIGRNLLYTPRIGSTQTFLQEKDTLVQDLPHGTILLAGEQTRGRGRGSNKWISPPIRTSLQFTFILDQCSLEFLSLLQIITAVSMVCAVRKRRPNAPIFIKWPNDIYIKKEGEMRKVGGILVNSQLIGDNCRALIGCGVNLGPCDHISSINDVVCGPNIHPEELLAEFCNEFEINYIKAHDNKLEIVKKYLEHWLHKDQTVRIHDEDTEATIIGIDEYGYLIARTKNNDIIKLQPDGNSFDMLSGLIKMKISDP